MKFWKVAAIVALATIPLLLIAKKKGFRPVCGDADDIFDYELKAE
jgi:hypothetical protein